jgi:hypothetical protein
MKAKQALLAAAVLCSLAAQAHAEEYRYRRFNQVDAFLDGSKTNYVKGEVAYAGKFFQWFGEKTACDKSGPDNCGVSSTKKRSDETIWLYGSETVAKKKFEWINADLEQKLLVQYSTKTKDSDEITRTATIARGYTAEAATFVNRTLTKTTYFGAWVKIASGVKCPGTIFVNCAKYKWDKDKTGNSVSSLVQESGEEVFTFLQYKTGQRPGYKEESDPK